MSSPEVVRNCVSWSVPSVVVEEELSESMGTFVGAGAAFRRYNRNWVLSL